MRIQRMGADTANPRIISTITSFVEVEPGALEMPESVPLSAPVATDMTSKSPQSRWARGIDILSVGMLLAFAFVSGSFVARNSDLWLHLATGRLIAGGDYYFGIDPFAFTTTGKYWVNHAWFFDLGMYMAFNWVGGGGLVVIKALAVSATAAIMLCTARGNGPRWVTIGCILLAILAMSPRLLLQPTIASLFLLSVCLGCVRAGGRTLVAVPVVIAIWVNLDGWFILGPALVVLFWIGRQIGKKRETGAPWPAWLIPASLVACLLSPHHVFAIRLPMELSPSVWSSAFATDPRFTSVFLSPWQMASLGAAGGYNLAAWAFFLLLGLGILSFAWNRPALRSWRLVVWLPFALLAAWQVRLVPFFAVVAGPITALNLGEVWPVQVFSRFGRAFVAAAAALLLALAWLGWTNGFSNRDRGAAWAVYADPTLERAATGIAAWRGANRIPPDAHVFGTHADLGHYLAWFAPGERSFLDSRLQLFTGISAEFLALASLDSGESAALLNNRSIAAVCLYDPDAGRMTLGLRKLANEPASWQIARIDGTAVLLVPKSSPHSVERFDAERTAFGGIGDLPRPSSGPATLVEPPLWWWPTRSRGRTGSWEADAASIYLRLFEIGDSKSPALPLLAIRAGRAGIESDPADAIAWRALGLGYSLLGERTWERESGAEFALLDYIRIIQITAALVQATLANPNSVLAHESLAQVYLRRNMIDLAYPQSAEVLRLVRRAGPFPGESPAAFAGRVAPLAANVERLEAALLDAENRFLIRTELLAGDPFARAQIAVELGLTQKAIDTLLNSHPDLYGIPGRGLLIDLFLQTGRIAECRVLLDRAEVRRDAALLGFYTLPRRPGSDPYRWQYQLPFYQWLDLCQCVAAGNYTGSAKLIDQLCVRLEDLEHEQSAPVAANSSAFLAIEAGLAAPPNPLLARLATVSDRSSLSEVIAQTRSRSVIRADLRTLAGILELESGNPHRASERFEEALSLYSLLKSLGLSAPGAGLAKRYNDVILRHQ